MYPIVDSTTYLIAKLALLLMVWLLWRYVVSHPRPA